MSRKDDKIASLHRVINCIEAERDDAREALLTAMRELADKRVEIRALRETRPAVIVAPADVVTRIRVRDCGASGVLILPDADDA